MFLDQQIEERYEELLKEGVQRIRNRAKEITGEDCSFVLDDPPLQQAFDEIFEEIINGSDSSERCNQMVIIAHCFWSNTFTFQTAGEILVSLAKGQFKIDLEDAF